MQLCADCFNGLWIVIPERSQSVHSRWVPGGGPPTRSVHHQWNGEAEECAQAPHGAGDPADEAEDEAHVEVVEPLSVRQLAQSFGHFHADDVGIENEETLVGNPRMVVARSSGYGAGHVLVLDRKRLERRFNHFIQVEGAQITRELDVVLVAEVEPVLNSHQVT